MAKKKKKIAHIRMFDAYYGNQSLCGITLKKTRAIIAYSDDKMNKLQSALTDFERLCHKCKHSHKLNLAKVK